MKHANYIRSELVGWIESHTDHFSLAHATDARHALHLLKPLGELVLTCDVLIQGRSTEKFARKLMRWAWLQLNSGHTIHNLLLSRPDLIILTSIYASFHRNGFQRHETLELIKYLAKTAFSASIQFPNWRRLDFEHALEALEIGKIRTSSVANMWCARRPEPWLIEHDSAYAMTHEVFYVTDFGRQPSRLPQKAAEYLSMWLPSWIDIFKLQQNFDLLAELLMVGCCLNEQPLSDSEYADVAEVVKKNGFLPGPENGGQNLQSGKDSSERIVFLSNYHTTLVGLMAADLALAKSSESETKNSNTAFTEKA
jgi:hypothetical protein